MAAGKSNLVEAMRWVMGRELLPRNMRASAMYE